MLFKFSFAARHQTIKLSVKLYPTAILPHNNVAISGYLVDTIHRLPSFMVTVKSYMAANSVWLSVLRFITDGMLGKLTRWLRMLGHDVTYFRSADDEKLLELAESEKRVLLTRDHELHRQATAHGLDAVLVEATDEAGKLADLAGRFGFLLEIDFSVSRCPKCNAQIESVPKSMVIDEVPEATAMHYDSFWRCLECGQVYWRGAHWKRIEKTLEEAKGRLERA